MWKKEQGFTLPERDSPTTAARGASWQSNTVRRALAILQLLNESPRPLSSTEISHALTLPKSTASVLLSTLESAGYISRDLNERRYSQNSRTYSLGLMRLGHLELARCSAPVLKEIARTFNVTAHIAVLDGDQALFLAKADGEIRPCCDIYSGRRTNLQCSAVGKILLAYMDTAKQAEYLSRHRVMRHTPRSIASAEQLTAMVDAVRHDGYALDDQEEELLVRCLAVPVFDQRNVFSCALGITGTPNEIRTGEFHRLINFLKRRSGQLKAVISQPSALSSSDS